MKAWLTSLAFLFLLITPGLQAQVKLAYFSSEAIIKQLPEAQDAQKQLDKLVEQWQSELTRMQDK